MLFRSVPTDIEAEQWNGTITSYERIEAMAVGKVRIASDSKNLLLLAGQDGATGWVGVPKDSWIAHWPGDQSDFWPIDDERMRAKYKPKEQV